MIYNKKQIKKILSSTTDKEVKNNLKITDEENFLERLTEIYIKLITDFEEEYTPVIEIVLQEIENQTEFQNTNFIEMTNNIINARKSLKKLEENIKNEEVNTNYLYLYEDKIRFEEIQNNFDRLIKKAKIVKKTNNKKEEVDNLLEYLKELIFNYNNENKDVINKILSGLEYLSKKEELISQEEIKRLMKNTKKSKKINHIEKNELTYIYKELEKIEENILKPEEKAKKLESLSFEELIKKLDELTDDYKVEKSKDVNSIVEILEQKVLNKEANYDYNRLLKIRQKVIEEIKSTPKMTRQKTKCMQLKELANKIENLEVSIIYDINNEETIKNYNIVNYIIFNMKELEYSKKLIEKNPHIINAYSLKTNNIITKVIESYIKEIKEQEQSGTYKDLCYYDKVLNLLLNSKTIYYNDEIIKKNINEVTNKLKNISKNKKRTIIWHQRLLGLLKNKEHIVDEETLNKMFNIQNDQIATNFNIIKKSSTENKEIIFTIDSSNTINRDDGISVTKKENGIYNVKIYISDPLYILSKDSKEIKKARNQGETLYLPDKNIEMFSENLITNSLSLDENKVRPVKVYDYVISKTGELISFNIQKEQIITTKNYNYEEFTKLLKQGTSDEEEKLIENLLYLERILNNEMHLNQETQDEILKKSEKEKSELLITTFMIYSNHKVAEYFTKENLPFVYRHYSENTNIDDEIIKAMPLLEKPTLSKILDEIGTGGHATYSVENKEHDGLNLSTYSHTTSPNRRYADILASECIDRLYFKKLNDSQIRVFEKYLKREVENLNDKLTRNEMYMEEYNKILTRK